MLKNKNKLKSIISSDNKNEQKRRISTFQIAATYIGTVVGAGFASGQEVLQFFGYYGLGGFAGLFITTGLFMIYGYIILRLGMDYHASSHVQIIRYAGGRWLGLLIDIVITFFLFGALTAMVAGSGAIFYQQFGIPEFWGNIIMVVITLGTTLLGISGVISAISFVVPLLLTGVFTVAVMSIVTHLPFSLANLQHLVPGKAPVPHWILSAFVYASYNIVLAVAVLAPLGEEVNNKEQLKKGATYGGIGLGIGAMAILFSLLLNMPQVMDYEIPMVYIAGGFRPWFQLIYSAILVAEIYTTAVGNLYGFVIRFTDAKGSKYKWYAVIVSLVALIASQFGFSTLVHYLYPAVGYAGLLLLGGLTYGMFKEYKEKNRGKE